MFSKLLVIILAVGVIATALLIIRQQRINTAHETSLTHQQILEHERVLWRLRSEIARRSRPEEIQRMIETLPNGWESIPDPTAREDVVGVAADERDPAHGTAPPGPGRTVNPYGSGEQFGG